MVGHGRDTWCLGTAKTERILGDWTLQGYSAVRHCGDTLRLVTAGMLGGLTLQGCYAVGPCSQAPHRGRG